MADQALTARTIANQVIIATGMGSEMGRTDLILLIQFIYITIIKISGGGRGIRTLGIGFPIHRFSKPAP